MSNLISASIRAKVEELHDSLHETFGRSVYYWKNPTEVILSENPNHNAFYEDAANNTTTSLVWETGSFTARILHGQKQPLESLKLPNGQFVQNNMILAAGEVRLKVEAAGKAIMDSSERFTIDGDVYVKESAPRSYSPFEIKFWSYYMKKVT